MNFQYKRNINLVLQKTYRETSKTTKDNRKFL